jgi:hypothetical protein
VLAGLFAFISVVGAGEEKVPLKDVPKAVLDAVKAKFPMAELTEAVKETEEGKTIFEIALKDKGRKLDVSATAEGKITEIEQEIAAKDLPGAVSSALVAKYPKATIQKAERITQIDGAKESKNYEVVLVTEGKKTLEVKVSPDGKIFKEEEGDDKD